MRAISVIVIDGIVNRKIFRIYDWVESLCIFFQLMLSTADRFVNQFIKFETYTENHN